MRLPKWALALALLPSLTGCLSSPTPPNSGSVLTPGAGGYPAPTALLPTGYPSLETPAPGYPAPPAEVTLTSAPPTEGATPSPVLITFSDTGITPAGITIPLGTTVTFIVESATGIRHRPYNDTPPNVFEAPEDMGNGATFSHTFTEPGTFTVRCRLHANLSATITVTP
jgi:plastocyanin